MKKEIILNKPQNDIQRKLLSEINKFSLNDFLHDNGPVTGAVILITPNQMLKTYNYVEKDRYYSHFDTVNEMYKAIYNENIDYNILWQPSIIKDGNIVLQLCIPKYEFSFAWLPENIENSQIDYLEKFNNELKSIKQKDQEYFKENRTVFYIKGYEYNEDLDELLHDLKFKKGEKKI